MIRRRGMADPTHFNTSHHALPFKRSQFTLAAGDWPTADSLDEANRLQEAEEWIDWRSSAECRLLAFLARSAVDTDTEMEAVGFAVCTAELLRQHKLLQTKASSDTDIHWHCSYCCPRPCYMATFLQAGVEQCELLTASLILAFLTPAAQRRFGGSAEAGSRSGKQPKR